MAQSDEIKRREWVARAAIRRAFETGDAEDDARLFVSHHLEELKPVYWRRHFSTAKPEPNAVLGLLVLRGHWGEDDELETFDFTLPDDVTQYVLCVRFDKAGTLPASRWKVEGQDPTRNGRSGHRDRDLVLPASSQARTTQSKASNLLPPWPENWLN